MDPSAKMKKLFFLLGVFLFFPIVSRAAFFPPKMEVLTVKTEHFYLHYDKKQPSTAQALLGMMEKVHEKVSRDFKWTPKGRTHVVLMDTSDDSNGLATVFPSNYVLLYVTPPDADSSLDNYRNYLEMLFTHEYTHIIHMDQHHKWANPPHVILGKVVAPNGITPGWMREGMAAFEESTYGQGRGHSSYSDMVIRASVLDDDFPHIDEAAGLGSRWPASDTQYLYGVRFWEWLADRYGEDTIQKYMKKYSSGLWLFSLNNKAKKVYGKSFYQLWKDWKQDLTEKYGFVSKALEKEGLTPLVPLVHDDGNLSYATPVPDNKGYAYIRGSMDEAAKIILSQNGKTSEVKAAARGQLSFSGDGKYLAYSALSGAEKHVSYADVYLYDLSKKTAGRLMTEGQNKKSDRASDPDFGSSQGKPRWMVLVRTLAGTDNLDICDFKDKLDQYMASRKSDLFDCHFITQSKAFTQFSNPRFSPDGEKIIVSRKDPDGNRDLVLYSRTGDELGKITDDPAQDNHPVWALGGIYYDSDKTGIPNIYRYDFKTRKSVQLTDVLTGVYQPQVMPDGKRLLVTYYTSKGPTLKQVPVADLKTVSQDKNSFTGSDRVVSKKMPLVEQEESKAIPSDNTAIPGSKKYSAFPSVLVPRYIIPTFLMLDNAFLMGASIGNYDPLYRHSWNLYADYRSDAAFTGGGANYSYLRYNPSLYVGVVRYALNWGDVYGVGQNFIEQRLQEYAGGVWTHGSHGFGLSYFFENRDNFSPIPTGGVRPATLDRYAGVQTTYTYGRYKYFPRSISQEDGPLVKLGFALTDSLLGSANANEQKVGTADLRYYFKMPWSEHHVFALRGAGGFAWGDQDPFGAFRFGGPFGDGTLGSRWFAFRGLPNITYGGDRALLFSAEYRLPLAHVDRGIGTWPTFLNKISMSFFSDYGNIWRKGDLDHKNFFDDFLLSVGTEIKGDFTLFYGVPITGRAGYAVVVSNQDRIANLGPGGFWSNVLGSNLKNGTFYLQFGQSF